MLLDRAGAGVSRCYGTGGRDLKDDVGAITALDAIARLDADPDTDVILCVSKPPSPEVAERVLRALAGVRHPGGRLHGRRRGRPGGGRAPGGDPRGGRPRGRPAGRASGAPGRRAACRVGDAAGSCAGSSRAARSAARRRRSWPSGSGTVHTNAPAGAARRLEGDPAGHACLDLGEEEYTRGRPHPMIDPAARAERLAVEAADPEVGRAADRRRARLRQPPRPRRRAGARDPGGAGRPPAARRGRLRPRHGGRPAGAQPPGGRPLRGRRALAPTNAAAARLAAALVG